MKELVDIQSNLKAPKDLYNKFGQYKYRSAESILEAVKPLLTKNKCTLTITDDIILVGDRIYVKATATLTNEKSESVSTTAFAREEETKKGMDGSQITGAASSYARKYALNGLFCIDDTKDSDATNDHGKVEAKKVVTSPLDPLDVAIARIKQTNTKSGLKKVYDDYPSYQNDPQFLETLSSRKKELA